MTNAYSTLANEGVRNNLYLIRKVEDLKGNSLYKHKSTPKTVFDYNYTFVLSTLLNNCYDSTLIDYNAPTCLTIKPKLTKTYAIKTGSTDSDSWIMGYNRDYTLGVWVGYDKNQKIKSSDSKISKNIWADTMENYLRDKNDSWYDKPENVVSVLVNPITGNLANNTSKKKKIVYYIKGTQPTTYDK